VVDTGTRIAVASYETGITDSNLSLSWYNPAANTAALAVLDVGSTASRVVTLIPDQPNQVVSLGSAALPTDAIITSVSVNVLTGLPSFAVTSPAQGQLVILPDARVVRPEELPFLSS
jgi:hypothetical protein